MKSFRWVHFVVICGLLTGLSVRAELRILARVDGRKVPVAGVEDNRIVALDNSRKIPLAHDTAYELDGDLLADPALVEWSPDYLIRMADAVREPLPPGVFAAGAARIRHLAEMDGKKMDSDFRARWPTEPGVGGLMVTAWLVKGKITQLSVTKVPPTRSTKFFFVGDEFQLTPEETAGQPVMLLWEQGRFIPPKPRLDDPRAQRALAAMVHGDIAPLQSALAAGMKPTVKGPWNETMLHFAAVAGAVDAMDLLLRQGAKVNATSDSGQTPLHWAARNGRLGAVEHLLVAKASVKIESGWGQTALLEAIKDGHREVARVLIMQGADVNAGNQDHETPYSISIDRGYADLTALMLDHGVDAKSYDLRQMERVLVTQAAKGNTAMVRFLLGQRVNPNAEADGTSALGAAALTGNAELVRVLLEAGAEIDHKSSDGRTALLTACLTGKMEIIRQLLDRGANVNVRAIDGRTCLNFAAIRNLPELVELLLAHGADPGIRSNDQLSPFDVALLRSAGPAARVLATHGATIDLKSARAPVLLEAALKLDLIGPVRAALAAGWSPDTKFRDVWPALAVARACGAKDCATALEQAGADRSLPVVSQLASAREIDAAPRLIAGVAAADPRDPDTVFPASLVELNIILDGQGRVQFPVVATGADWRLDYAALQAVSSWRFTPVTKGGQPVAVRIKLPMEFPASVSLAIKPEKADLLPVPLKRVAPVYPTELSRSGQVGRVNVAFTIDVDGRVRDTRVRLSSHPAFRQPALDAVAKWIFKPGELDGKPVAIRFEQEIVFSLN